MTDSGSPTLDLRFALKGERAPSWHGHLLYAAISNAVPALHEAAWLGIHPLPGRVVKGTREMLLAPNARLALRMPAQHIPDALPLAGKGLQVGEHALRLGVPEIAALAPSNALVARLVIVKGFTDPEPFKEAVRRQLDALEIVADLDLGPRRVQPIHGKRVIGFGVRVTGLDAPSSLRLQSVGIGGRRRMGCGLFRPFGATPA